MTRKCSVSLILIPENAFTKLVTLFGVRSDSRSTQVATTFSRKVVLPGRPDQGRKLLLLVFGQVVHGLSQEHGEEVWVGRDLQLGKGPQDVGDALWTKLFPPENAPSANLCEQLGVLQAHTCK